MVRLAVIAVLLLLSACAQRPPISEPSPQEKLSIEALNEGDAAPALMRLFNQAEQARQRQEFDAAQAYLEQARQIAPRDPDVLYRKAWLFMQMRQPVAAEQLSQRGLVYAQPASLIARRLHWLLAQSLSTQGRMMESYAAEQQATAP